MSESPITPQCNRGRHAVCAYAGMNADGFCDCECHDEGAQATPRMEAKAPAKVGIGRAPGLPEVPCREPSCDHAPFSTVQGERVHWQRMHSGKRRVQPIADALVVSMPADRTPVEFQRVKVRWLLVARAVAFLTGSTADVVTDAALDTWAASKLEDDDVRDLVAILERRDSAQAQD